MNKIERMTIRRKVIRSSLSRVIRAAIGRKTGIDGAFVCSRGRPHACSK
jgi:hypothetical protein